MLFAHTISVSIARPSAEVYDYLSAPANFPKWSVFITGMRRDGEDWVATTTAGEVHIRFSPRNVFGVVDHTVTVAPGVDVFVPLRVVPNQTGSEVLFTVFRQPTQDDRQFDEDLAMVATDLAGLKKTLERE